jgi:ferritin
MTQPAIPAKVFKELTRQYNQELSAAHAYQALSFWCQAQNLKGFASYFQKQAGEELSHARKFAGHLVDRQSLPETGAISAPKHQFSSLLEAAQHVQGMEQNNTQGIHAAYEAALAAKDYPAQVLLHWFINEQVEEERWSTEMVERVKAASCAGSLMDLDRHIEKLLDDDAESGSDE